MSDYRRDLAFKAGQKAAAAGKPESANNRQPGTIYYDDWLDGHLQISQSMRSDA